MKFFKNILCILIIVIITVISFSIFKFFNNEKKEKKVINIEGAIPYRTEYEMILDSDLIITGKVKEIKKSKWSNPDYLLGKHVRNVLQTDVLIDVEKVLDGNFSKNSVIVRIDKGEDENTIVYSEGYPDFVLGEDVLLFLARDDSDIATNEDYYVLTGMRLSKYNLINDSSLAKESEEKIMYKNEVGELKLTELISNIEKVKEDKPKYKEEKLKKQEEIIKNNIELFGE